MIRESSPWKRKTLSLHPAKRRTLYRRELCHSQSLQSREILTRTNTEGSAQGANKARPFLENNYLGCLDQPEWHEEKIWRRFETAHDPRHTASSVKHGRAVWWDELTLTLGYWCLVMMWQRTETARRILKWCTLCPDSDKLSKADWAVLHSKNGRWPKHTAKATQELEVKAVNYSAMAKSISWSQPNWVCISLAEDKTKGRKTHEQTTTQVSSSKDLAKHHKGGNPVFGDVHELQT